MADNGTNVIDLDALVAEPVKVRLEGREYPLPNMSVEQVVNLHRAWKEGIVEGENEADILLRACETLDELFPGISAEKPFRQMHPLQIRRIIELLATSTRDMMAGAESGNAQSRPASRARRRAAAQN